MIACHTVVVPVSRPSGSVAGQRAGCKVAMRSTRAQPKVSAKLALGSDFLQGDVLIKGKKPRAGCVAKATSPIIGQMGPELKEAIDKFVSDNKLVLFMKGTKDFPQCGFSNTCVQILNQFGAPYETVNVLEDEAIRQGMKEYSSWPTFPQMYIGGEFYGGCDIMIETYQSGELQEEIEKTMAS